MRDLNGWLSCNRKRYIVNPGLLEGRFAFMSDGLSYPSDLVRSALRKSSPPLPHLAVVAREQVRVLLILERWMNVAVLLG